MSHRTCLLFALCLVGSTAHADVIVSTFGPTDSFSSTAAASLTSMGPPGYSARAIVFTVPATRYLTDIDVALRHLSGASNLYTIALSQDSGGLPGSALEVWNTPAPTTPGIVKLSSVSHPLLAAGGSYWLTLSSATPTTTTIGQWMRNDQGINTGIMKSQNFPGGSWAASSTTDAAYRLLGAEAPEPPALVLLLSGTLVIVGREVNRRRLARRRRG